MFRNTALNIDNNLTNHVREILLAKDIVARHLQLTELYLAQAEKMLNAPIFMDEQEEKIEHFNESPDEEIIDSINELLDLAGAGRESLCMINDIYQDTGLIINEHKNDNLIDPVIIESLQNRTDRLYHALLNIINSTELRTPNADVNAFSYDVQFGIFGISHAVQKEDVPLKTLPKSHI